MFRSLSEGHQAPQPGTVRYLASQKQKKEIICTEYLSSLCQPLSMLPKKLLVRIKKEDIKQ